MSPEARPAATLFQPGSGALPPALEPAIIDSDSPILLLVGADTGDAAARAAIGLADARAAAGKPVILADARLRGGRMHELLDLDNLEGLADIFLFGASLDRVRTRPGGRSFDFVPTGAYAPDPGALLGSARWDGIARSLRAEGGRLFLFVTAETPGLGALSRRVGEAVLIGGLRSVERAASALDPGCEVVAVVEPASATASHATAGTAGEAAEAPTADEAAEVTEAPEVTEEPEEPEEPEVADRDLGEPVVFRSERNSRSVFTPLLLILLLAALVAAGWFAYREYLAPANPAVPTEPGREEPAGAARGEPFETPIPISVAVEAHQDLESGLARLASLREVESDVGFFLAPVAVRGVRYYRLLAGPVADRAGGQRLMARLVEREHKTAEDQWAIRPTEYAFHLGEFDTEVEATARVDALAALGVPTYVVPIRYDAGPPRYRVYGGAYESEAEAQAMREMLTEAGLEARLVSRTGQPIEEGP